MLEGFYQAITGLPLPDAAAPADDTRDDTGGPDGGDDGGGDGGERSDTWVVRFPDDPVDTTEPTEPAKTPADPDEDTQKDKNRKAALSSVEEDEPPAPRPNTDIPNDEDDTGLNRSWTDLEVDMGDHHDQVRIAMALPRGTVPTIEQFNRFERTMRNPLFQTTHDNELITWANEWKDEILQKQAADTHVDDTTGTGGNPPATDDGGSESGDAGDRTELPDLEEDKKLTTKEDHKDEPKLDDSNLKKDNKVTVGGSPEEEEEEEDASLQQRNLDYAQANAAREAAAAGGAPAREAAAAGGAPAGEAAAGGGEEAGELLRRNQTPQERYGQLVPLGIFDMDINAPLIGEDIENAVAGDMIRNIGPMFRNPNDEQRREIRDMLTTRVELLLQNLNLEEGDGNDDDVLRLRHAARGIQRLIETMSDPDQQDLMRTMRATDRVPVIDPRLNATAVPIAPIAPAVMAQVYAEGLRGNWDTTGPGEYQFPTEQAPVRRGEWDREQMQRRARAHALRVVGNALHSRIADATEYRRDLRYPDYKMMDLEAAFEDPEEGREFGRMFRAFYENYAEQAGLRTRFTVRKTGDSGYGPGFELHQLGDSVISNDHDAGDPDFQVQERRAGTAVARKLTAASNAILAGRDRQPRPRNWNDPLDTIPWDNPDVDENTGARLRRQTQYFNNFNSEHDRTLAIYRRQVTALDARLRALEIPAADRNRIIDRVQHWTGPEDDIATQDYRGPMFRTYLQQRGITAEEANDRRRMSPVELINEQIDAMLGGGVNPRDHADDLFQAIDYRTLPPFSDATEHGVNPLANDNVKRLQDRSRKSKLAWSSIGTGLAKKTTQLDLENADVPDDVLTKLAEARSTRVPENKIPPGFSERVRNRARRAHLNADGTPGTPRTPEQQEAKVAQRAELRTRTNRHQDDIDELRDIETDLRQAPDDTQRQAELRRMQQAVRVRLVGHGFTPAEIRRALEEPKNEDRRRRYAEAIRDEATDWVTHGAPPPPAAAARPPAATPPDGAAAPDEDHRRRTRIGNNHADRIALLWRDMQAAAGDPDGDDRDARHRRNRIATRIRDLVDAGATPEDIQNIRDHGSIWTKKNVPPKK
jgi:hypothetical protein